MSSIQHHCVELNCIHVAFHIHQFMLEEDNFFLEAADVPFQDALSCVASHMHPTALVEDSFLMEDADTPIQGALIYGEQHMCQLMWVVNNFHLVGLDIPSLYDLAYVVLCIHQIV